MYIYFYIKVYVRPSNYLDKINATISREIQKVKWLEKETDAKIYKLLIKKKDEFQL